MAVGDASQCTGKSRVNRVPEIVRGLRDTLGGSFVPEVSAFEVETICRVTAVDPSTARALAANGGEIAAPGNLDDDFVVLARSGEILGEPQPKAACFHSDDRIDLRVEIDTPIEYHSRNLAFRERHVGRRRASLHNMTQKPLQPDRTAKSWAAADQLQLFLQIGWHRARQIVVFSHLADVVLPDRATRSTDSALLLWRLGPCPSRPSAGRWVAGKMAQSSMEREACRNALGPQCASSGADRSNRPPWGMPRRTSSGLISLRSPTLIGGPHAVALRQWTRCPVTS